MIPATPQSRSKPQRRRVLLIGALVFVGIVYLCLPRSWFEIPDEHSVSNNPQPAPSPLSPVPEAPPADLTALRAEAEKSPDDFGARSRYGMGLVAAGRFPEAEQEFLAAARLAPESPGVYHNLGVFYNNVNQPVRADAAFKRELELDPGNARAHHFRGVALQAQRKNREAEQLFRRAMSLEPDFPDTYLSLAMLLSRDAPEEEVRKLVEEYIRLSGNRGLAYYVLSGAYRSRRDFATAVRYGELAVAAEPEKYAYLHHLGQVYSYAKRYPEAEATLQKALSKAQDPTTIFIELGMNAQNAGRYPEAISFFQQALQASPKTGNIHLYMARVYQRMGDKASAQREETTFRKWQRDVLEADARAKKQRVEREANSTHSSQKP
jgi:tetratricopeptide (TPR) repeat protein